MFIESLQNMNDAVSDLLDSLDSAINATNGDDAYSVGMRNGMKYAKYLINEEDSRYDACKSKIDQSVSDCDETMTANKLIRKLMFEKGVSLEAMAKALGKSRGNDISARLTCNNMTCDKVVEMLNVLDCDLVVIPRNCKGSRMVID